MAGRGGRKEERGKRKEEGCRGKDTGPVLTVQLLKVLEGRVSALALHVLAPHRLREGPVVHAVPPSDAVEEIRAAEVDKSNNLAAVGGQKDKLGGRVAQRHLASVQEAQHALR